MDYKNLHMFECEEELRKCLIMLLGGAFVFSVTLALMLAVLKSAAIIETPLGRGVMVIFGIIFLVSSLFILYLIFRRRTW